MCVCSSREKIRRTKDFGFLKSNDAFKMFPACQRSVLAVKLWTITRTACEQGAGWKEFKATKPAWSTRSEVACTASCQPARFEGQNT